MPGKQWLIQRLDSGQYLQASVSHKRGRFHSGPVQCTQELSSRISGNIYFSIDSNKGLVLVDQFPQGLKTDLLKLQIDSRLNNLALMDEGVAGAISYKRLENRGKMELLSILVLPEDELLTAYNGLTKKKKVHFLSCAPSTAALAALLSLISPEPFIILLIQKDKGAVIAVRDGMPLYMQTIPLIAAGEVEMGTIPHALNFCRQSLQRDFDINSSRFVCLGVGRNDIDYELIGEKNWEPDWQKQIVAEKEDLMHHPEFYGALFTGTEYSLLPHEYNLSWNIKRITNVTLVCCMALGLGLAFLAWQNIQKSIPVRERLAADSSKLARHEKELESKLPETQDVRHLEHYLTILAKGAKEPKLALLVEQLVKGLPEKVTIAGLDAIKRETNISPPVATAAAPPQIAPLPGGAPQPMPTTGEVAISVAEAGFNKTLVLLLTSSSEGEYDRVRARFERTVTALSNSFTLENIRWEYTEANSTGILECDLIPLQQDQ